MSCSKDDLISGKNIVLTLFIVQPIVYYFPCILISDIHEVAISGEHIKESSFRISNFCISNGGQKNYTRSYFSLLITH